MSRTVAASTAFVNAFNINPGANSTTTSTTTVSTGVGVNGSSVYTARYLIMGSVTLSHSVADTGVTLQVFRLAGGAVPANGVASSGTLVGTSQIISPTASGQVTIPLILLDNFNTTGPVTYYLAYFANAAGTATLYGAGTGLGTNLTVVEI